MAKYINVRFEIKRDGKFRDDAINELLEAATSFEQLTMESYYVDESNKNDDNTLAGVKFTKEEAESLKQLVHKEESSSKKKI